MTQNELRKSAKKMAERAAKLERGYNYMFTDVIDLAAPDWFARVHSSIADQQNGLVWVSERVGSAVEDDESELDQGMFYCKIRWAVVKKFSLVGLFESTYRDANLSIILNILVL